jgi:hypothetical protein
MDYKDVLPLRTGNVALIFLRSHMEHIGAYCGQVSFRFCILNLPELIKHNISTSNTHLLESQFVIALTSALKVLYIKMLLSPLHKCLVMQLAVVQFETVNTESYVTIFAVVM